MDLTGSQKTSKAHKKMHSYLHFNLQHDAAIVRALARIAITKPTETCIYRVTYTNNAFRSMNQITLILCNV